MQWVQHFFRTTPRPRSALLALHVRDEVVNVRLVAERLGARPDTSSPCAPSVELDGGAELAVGADDASVGVAGVCDGCRWVCRHSLSGFYSSNAGCLRFIVRYLQKIR